MSGAERCASIADDRTWLDCFYGSAQPMRTILELPPAPVSQTRLVPPPGAAYAHPVATAGVMPVRPREDSGGFWAGVLGSGKPAVIDMPMVSYRFASNGTFTATLQNGQVYRQDETDTTFARWTGPAANYRVTVTASADKFILKVKGDPGVIFHVNRR
jgi:hypothetical protein